MQVIEIANIPISLSSTKLTSIGGFGMISEVFVWDYNLNKKEMAGFYLQGEAKFFKEIVVSDFEKKLEKSLDQ